MFTLCVGASEKAKLQQEIVALMKENEGEIYFLFFLSAYIDVVQIVNVFAMAAIDGEYCSVAKCCLIFCRYMS